MREQWAEVAAGLAVILIAGAFLAYSLSVGGVGRRAGGYEVVARFGNVGALEPGAPVSVAGVKVGSVADIRLDPKTYLAVTTLRLDPSVRLPSDSTARITSDTLLGGVHVAIAPGGAPGDLKPGAEIENTQGAVDLFGLIGQFLRPQPASGSDVSPTASASAGKAAEPGAAALPDY